MIKVYYTHIYVCVYIYIYTYMYVLKCHDEGCDVIQVVEHLPSKGPEFKHQYYQKRCHNETH
jgi:hypothetical protein